MTIIEALFVHDSTPASILFFGVAEDARRRLCVLAPAACSIVVVDNFVEAERALTSSYESCVVISTRSMHEAAFVGQLDRLRSAFPHVSIIAIADSRAPSVDAILSLGRGGVSKVLVLNARLSPSDFQEAIGHGSRDRHVQRIWQASSRLLPEPFGTVMQTMLRYAHEPLSTRRMAAIVGMHERTLRRYCEAHGLPSPQWIAGWARLLIAADYLEEPGRSIEQVSASLGFSSPGALSNQLQRYTQRSPRALRAIGPTRAVFDAMVGAALADRPPDRERPKLRLVSHQM